MCGRYVFISPLRAVQTMFRFEQRPNLRPNSNVAPTHEMPIILGSEDHDHWLDLDADPGDVLRPCPSGWLEAYPVDPRVGNVRNNDPDLLKPLTI